MNRTSSGSRLRGAEVKTAMNASKLQRQLLRDLKKSPAKAGALGLLSVVAIYFWAPLVLGYFSKDKPPAAAAAESNQAVAAAPEAEAATPATPVGLPAPWKQLAAWIEKDRGMASADASLAFRLPFGDPTVAVEKIDEEGPRGAAQPAEVDVVLDLEKLGLKLTGTMVSGRRRVAVINGRPYAEGAQIQAGNGVVLNVQSVTERQVVLEYESRRLELVAESSAAASRANFEIQPARAGTKR